MHVLIGLILSSAIGVSLGLIGGGGSIITVPVLVYALGVDPHEAVAMSLAVVGATSVVGALLHSRRGTVRVRTGLLFASTGVMGAIGGAQLTSLVSPQVLMLAFAGLMLVVATSMLIPRPAGESAETRRKPKAVRAAIAGFIVGTLTGFLGVGGGFLVVPALVMFAGLTMREAVGTSLVVIAVNCGAGLVGHIGQAGFDVALAALVTLLAVAGTLAGSRWSHRLSPVHLRTGFALFVVVIAVWLVFKNAGLAVI
ncbi:MAG: sulfite exporter TauE/SafE family protein [Blastocatellia bacterium]|nr:sulfite exporter TauE/SafE family protein [Blastocatellia bacterium]MBK6425671.1 sulfite exporter TauE/SafE family protein [Blastocatellia bacterium]